jgi:hypothetical protein
LVSRTHDRGRRVESELALRLHQLLEAIGNRIASLPDPQRQALDAAFGIDDRVEPDPFRIALAAYRLVSDAADSGPLLLIADDAHWLDRSSLDVLSFIARRLDDEPVVLIAALRDGFSTALEEAGLPILELGRLRHPIPEAARQRRVGLSPDVRGRGWPRPPASARARGAPGPCGSSAPGRTGAGAAALTQRLGARSGPPGRSC